MEPEINSSQSRRRPFEVIENYPPPLFKTPRGDSFPSSHTSSWTSFFVALSLVHHPYAEFAGLWAGLVAFSGLRIHLAAPIKHEI
jgi:membrane-associated phospholipid phosphatase